MKSESLGLHLTYGGCEKIFESIDSRKSEFVEELVRICEIPAPTFGEQRRAEYFASLFDPMGTPASIDAAGNVRVSILNKEGPHVVLSAHLDTVFPFETICVKRKGSVLHAPASRVVDSSCNGRRRRVGKFARSETLL
jgi:hypothetical protein